MKKIYTIIAGYFGNNNIGDELILDGSIKEIKAKKEVIIVISANPWYHRKKYNVKTMYKYDLVTFIYRLLKSKKLIFPGGGIFQDITSSRSLYYYLFLIFASKFFGVKVELHNIGVGPFVNYFNKFITLNILKHCNYISVRDKYSYNLLRKKVRSGKLHLTKDLLYKLWGNYDIPIEVNEKKITIGINLRKWHNIKKIIREIGIVLSEFKGIDNINFLLIPFSPGDEKVMRFLIPYLNDNTFIVNTNPENAFYPISKCDVTIGMRLHFNMMAQILDKKGINIAYDKKCEYALDGMKNFPIIRTKEITHLKFNKILKKYMKFDIIKNE
jgi:polysaccharide pyruvyl transferase CsaB